MDDDKYILELTKSGVLDAVGDPLSIQDTEFRVLYQNRSHRDLVGDQRGEYCYMAYQKRDSVCEGCHLAKSFKDGRVHVVERSRVTVDGVIYTENKASLIKDPAGRIIAGIEVIRDITERKKAEIALMESRELYGSIVESMSDGIMVLDKGFQCLYWNQSMEEITGFSRDELVGSGKAPWEVLPYLVEQGVDNAVIQAMSGTRAGKENVRYLLADGTQRFTNEVYIPLKDLNGEVRRIVGVVRDKTEHINMEKEILQVEDRERSRIGLNLHDDLGQLLTGIAFKTSWLAKQLESGSTVLPGEAAEITDLVNRAKEQVKHISRDLSPLQIKGERGLMSAMEELVSNTENIFNIRCVLNCECPVLVRNGQPVVHMYRIAREAILNAVRECNSGSVEIELTKDEDIITMLISSDGTGVSDIAELLEGIGFRTMKYRANMIGASVDIKKGPDGGIVFRCVLRDA